MIRPFDFVLWENPVSAWLTAFAISIGTVVIISLVLRFVRQRVAAFAARSESIFDDTVVHALAKTRGYAVLVASLYAGSTFLTLPARPGRALNVVTTIVVLVQLGLWVSTGLSFWLAQYTQRKLVQDRGVATTVSAIGFAAKLLLWLSLFLVALDTAGVNVTALVAGLGIGGIAVALAAQNILGDLFSSVSIILDKPFVLGDFIRVDDHMGAVEHIGLRSTRIRSLSGERLVFSNGDLLRSRIRNFGHMRERRIAFDVGVSQDATHEQLRQVPSIIRDAITSHERVRFDRSHFARYTDTAMVFETVYFVLTDDYYLYMDIQQAVNLRMHERFEQEGIRFARPVHVVQLVADGRAPQPSNERDGTERRIVKAASRT
ncbi:MAG TPA: mechanosensitive ion channel family protein [Gemmatimonadaceae bacterium]|nr:mechanosensitive ion channel family protein [Gemmatimonadaceae bacterium]